MNRVVGRMVTRIVANYYSPNDPRHDTRHHPNMIKIHLNKGFTLLELMVVIAIISLLSASVTVGFERLGQVVELQETAGIIKDLVRKLELETLEGTSHEHFLQFEPYYLISEISLADSPLSLDYDGFDTEKCPAEANLRVSTTEPVHLSRWDENGNPLEVATYSSNTAVCVNFLQSYDMEWEYQLSNESYDVSDKIRLMHFNLKREADSPLIRLIAGTNYTLRLKSPYVKKQFFLNGNPEASPPVLILENSDGEQEKLSL